MKIAQRLEKIKKLEDIETPWEVKHIIGELGISGDQLYIKNTENDFADIEQFRKAVEWLVNELDGTVTWEKK